MIIHFAVPSHKEAFIETVKFTFEVVDPLLEDFWGKTIVPYAEEWIDDIVNSGYLKLNCDKRMLLALPK